MPQNNPQGGNKKGGNENRNSVPGSGTANRSADEQSRNAGGNASLHSGRTTAQGQHTASGNDGNQKRVTNDTSMNEGQKGTAQEPSQAQGVGQQKYDSGKQTHR